MKKRGNTLIYVILVIIIYKPKQLDLRDKNMRRGKNETS